MSWKFKKSHGISPLLIANHALEIPESEIPIIPYRPTAVFWLMQTFSLCSKFQIVMLGKSKLKSF